MKKSVFFALIMFSMSLLADDYLKKEDQQYYKNDIMEGRNTRERIDSTVKEINKLHAEMATLRNEIAELKREIETLKAKK